MKLPRDWSGDELVHRLAVAGYAVTRRSGSHMRLTREATVGTTEHHVTIPRHSPLRIGTLASILDDVASHLQITRDELLTRMV